MGEMFELIRLIGLVVFYYGRILVCVRVIMMSLMLLVVEF